MAKKPDISTDDIDAFQETVKGTRRLTHNKVSLKRPLIKSKATPKPAQYDDYKLNAAIDVPKVASEEVISYKHSSISNKILRKLRKGQYNVDAILDLHGMTIAQAEQEVINFIHACLQDGSRMVLIVHGKGTHSDAPALKNMVNKWLRQIDVVLAFCSATIAHGGRGAAYVLLKHKINGE